METGSHRDSPHQVDMLLKLNVQLNGIPLVI
jgi:hypothetical protein